ncbi:MAG: helicase-related protein [Thermoanaerobaculia bacterium]
MSLFPKTATRDAPRLAPFQAEAVEWILDLLALRGGALLADGVGLGKSWVAAAVARAWEVRGGAVELVVPAPLVGQWREIVERFGLVSPVVSHDSLAGREAPAGPRERLVIVDEAHRFRNPRTRRYRAMALRTRDAAVLLVTATPICNSPDDLRSLLGLLVSDDALADRGVPSLDEAFRIRSGTQLREIVGEISVCRDSSVLPAALRFARVSTRTVSYRPARGLDRELGRVLLRLEFPLVPRAAAALMRTFLWRRLESSVTALRSTLERLRRLHARSLECAARGVAMTGASYRAAFGDRDAPMFQDLLFPELWGAEGNASPVSAGELKRELEALETAIRFLARSFADDPKIELVARVVAEYPGRPGIVFAQSRDTARAIWSSLRGTYRCALVTGDGCRRDDGEHATLGAILNLLGRGKLDVLVATDVGCEGLNLQRASWVVHADLPWNPSKLEQRIGRVGRIGQSAEHLDDVVLVAERSPVFEAITRKLGERKDLIQAAPAGERVGKSARLDSVRFSPRSERQCVVDLLEHRRGREGRAKRPLDSDGSLGSLREGREAATAIPSSVPATPEAIAAVGRALDSHIARVRSRELQPAHLAASSAQARLLDVAERSGDVTRELIDALSRRYRAGAEILIAETLANGIGARPIAMLLRALRAEAFDDAGFEASVRGCVVSESWLRSSPLLRRRR